VRWGWRAGQGRAGAGLRGGLGVAVSLIWKELWVRLRRTKFCGGLRRGWWGRLAGQGRAGAGFRGGLGVAVSLIWKELWVRLRRTKFCGDPVRGRLAGTPRLKAGEQKSYLLQIKQLWV
jgi:hypothetical protein